jgi:hypothetical protein
VNDQFTADYFRRRAYVVQHLLWSIEMQGKCITLRGELADYKRQKPPIRNAISTFTKRSRLRMLKFAASVDWPRSGDGLFVTLTYPPENVPQTVAERNTQRYLIHRHMEKHLGREIPLMWRIEWKPRLSGKTKGNAEPHLHMILFGVPFISHGVLREAWQSTIHAKRWSSVWIDRLSDGKKFGIYMSKYAAKLPDKASLDNVSYLNISGRHYGYQRKSLIPRLPRTVFHDVPFHVVERLGVMQRHYDQQWEQTDGKGFCLLGKRADAWHAEIMRLCLDEGVAVSYDDEIKGRSGCIPQ